MVDGLGKDGQEVSEDETSELTIDGLSQQSQLLMDAFINDQSDEDANKDPALYPQSSIQTDGRIVRYGTIPILGRWSLG